MGYPMMRFVPNTASGTDRSFTFYFQKSGNDKEKLTVESQYYKDGSTMKTVFKTTLNTSDIEQFNAMLRNIMNHPDFEMIGPVLSVNSFKSKPSTGVREQLTFGKGYTSSGTGELNIQVPIVYTVTYIREK
ncbi:hypothetical protein [Flavobacterium sp. 38-13]|uniref:hypothetical protein n=1 Tax=Flavobacterium sp. 38-13 TaxID=1896168 RepID=UPI00257D2739|nr:hypothetical protein [Flavobacterium sp. 38-13]